MQLGVVVFPGRRRAGGLLLLLHQVCQLRNGDPAILGFEGLFSQPFGFRPERSGLDEGLMALHGRFSFSLWSTLSGGGSARAGHLRIDCG